MISKYTITLDSDIENNPIKRIHFEVQGLARNESIDLAKEYAGKSGFKYTLSYVIAGHVEGK